MNDAQENSRIAACMFTDMVDSVALQRRLGTDAYSRFLDRHDQIFREVLGGSPGGKLCERTGDGFLSEFRTSADAINVALAFQLRLRESQWENERPKIRIGIHQGQLTESLDADSGAKAVGMPLNIAARVMGLAQGGQILMTRPVYDDARHFVREHPISKSKNARPPLEWRNHGQYMFKGIEDPIEIFEIGIPGFAPFIPPPDSEKAHAVQRRFFLKLRPVIGAALAVAFGLALWKMPFGEPWENLSYDYLFRFGQRVATNKVALVLMDNPAYTALNQRRNQFWDRKLHATLLEKLTADNCPLVVFDVHFASPGVPEIDQALATAMARHGNVVLMADVDDPKAPRLTIEQVKPPVERFLQAAASYGIGNAGVSLLETPRRHWPFPAPAGFDSLPRAAAIRFGVQLSDQPAKQWLRYYGESGGWETWSYHLALSNAPGYFRDKVVFIGNHPETATYKLIEPDKFCTPYTRWTGKAVGGVEIIATSFLNLINADWLRRPPWWWEAALLLIIGTAVGGLICMVRPYIALLIALGVSIVVTIGALALGHYSSYWFSWLVIVGGQIPCALLWAFISLKVSTSKKRRFGTLVDTFRLWRERAR